MYSGPDRTERLIAGAKKEGVLTVYSSMTSRRPARARRRIREEIRRQAAVLARELGEHPAPRLIEHRAGRYEVDAIETSAAEMESLHREGMLQEVRSPHLADIVPAALRPHREWVGDRLNIISAGYNTKLFARTRCRRPMRTSPIRAGRAGSASRPTTRSGSARSPMRWARRRSSSCSATWCGSTASRCARATRCSPISWSRARCRSRSRSITTRPSS